MATTLNVVPDSTDSGTLRPNFELIAEAGNAFTPLICPEFTYRINLPLYVKLNDSLGIFIFFFTFYS